MLASVLHINKSEYDKLRQKSIQDVKRTNGPIDMMEAINESENNYLENNIDNGKIW